MPRFEVSNHLVGHIHPLPHLEELVENVAGNECYVTLDLKDAYYQVILDEEWRDLTTFTEWISPYRFKRLSCSASLIVRQLQGALPPLMKKNCLKSYLNDIIVCAPTYQVLLQRLDQIFDQMQKVEIKLNLSKCKMGQQEVKFLEHV